MSEKPSRSILVECTGGEYTLVEGIPADAKITFGPLNPGKGYSDGKALRIYTSMSNQLAVITNVVAFQDLSLSVKHRKFRDNGESKFVYGADGTKKTNTRYRRTIQWVDSAAILDEAGDDDE